MKPFAMHLQGASEYRLIQDVTSFVGQDDSGSFGIQPGRARMLTVLAYGLARYRTLDEQWTYLAIPAGVLYFVNNELYITTRRFFVDVDYQRISTALLEQLLQEEQQLKMVKDNIYRLEQEMFRRLWQIERGAK